VVNPETDAISGQPEMKHTPVRVAPWSPGWRALVLTRERVVPRAECWHTVPREGHWRAELAGRSPPAEAWAALIALAAPGGRAAEFADAGRFDHRVVVLDASGRLAAALFLHASGEPVPADRDWLGEQFAAASLTPSECRSILAGRPQAQRPARGPIVCSCFAVGQDAILAVIGAGAASVAAVGAATRAGTNCGSCRPEIGALITTARQRSAA
jgi:assimilatory nitrate reductase catalytic subunit